MASDDRKLRVAVTGGSGKIGREAIRALQAAGHVAVNFDIRPSPDPVRTAIADVAEFGEAMAALSGVDLAGGAFDAVVHLAGIPGPGFATDPTVFKNNTMSTYNVFQACQRLGVRRVVWASSETLLGQPYDAPPAFLPLDESVTQSAWSYTLSKELGETMAEAFARWSPETSITSLRFSNVYAAEEYARLPQIQANPQLRRLNLWAYVDARDCGEACRLAVEAALPGHHAMLIAAADTCLDTPSAELAAQWFPEVPLRRALSGFEGFLSIDKARSLLGFEPRHSWRDELRR